MMLQACGLALERGQRRLFSDLNLSVQSGHALCVVGPNGAGKTSLLRVLAGLLSPSEGRVTWRGQTWLADRETLHRELLYVGHQSGLKDDLSAIENVQFSSALRGVACSVAQAREALAQAGLAGKAGLPVRCLSQGQRRRVLLSQLLLQPRPGLAVLDEPFNALDQGAARWLSSSLVAWLTGGGVLVYTTHQPAALPESIEQTLPLGKGT